MKFHVLTLFPEMVERGLNTSILGRAMEKGLIELHAVNIRDYTLDKHGKVDDYTYGGGAGMLMQAQPVFDAYSAVTGGRALRTVYVTPQGIPFTQKKAAELAGEEELVFLCGHYEGIDERVLREIVTDYVSIGDYVLTGGELPAMVMMDAISRLVPEVLGNEGSARTESFHNDLLEYPQYSRPEEWRGKRVPEVLLSGNHRLIEAWRREQAVERTRKLRPDLYEKYERKQKLIKRLSKKKRNNIHMIESLARGKSEILWEEGDDILLYDASCGCCSILAASEESGEKMLTLAPPDTRLFLTAQEWMNDPICRRFSFVVFHECYQFCYTGKEALPVRHKDIRLLDISHLDYLAARYAMGSDGYIRDRLLAKVVYGAFADGQIAGFVGLHNDGSLGMLYVEDAFRRQGIGESLEAFAINRLVEKGCTPYGHVVVGNEASMRMQESMGLYKAERNVFWLGKGDS